VKRSSVNTSKAEKLTRQNSFLKHLATLREIRAAAAKAGISECTPYEWRKKADFRRRMEKVNPPRVPTEVLKKRYLEELSKSGNTSDAAKKAGVGESTPKLWRKNPEFAKAEIEAKACAENAAKQRVLKEYSQTGRVGDALAKAGVSRRRYQRWLKDPGFKQQVDEAKPTKPRKKRFKGRKETRVRGTGSLPKKTKQGYAVRLRSGGKDHWEHLKGVSEREAIEYVIEDLEANRPKVGPLRFGLIPTVEALKNPRRFQKTIRTILKLKRRIRRGTQRTAAIRVISENIKPKRPHQLALFPSDREHAIKHAAAIKAGRDVMKYCALVSKAGIAWSGPGNYLDYPIAYKSRDKKAADYIRKDKSRATANRWR
jgi:hypothetical protein